MSDTVLTRGLLTVALVPAEWNIHVFRTEDGRYVLEYEEIVRRPEGVPDEMFIDAVRNTSEIVENLMSQLPEEVKTKFGMNVDLESGTATLRLRIEGTLRDVASFLFFEFAAFTPLANLTLLDMVAVLGTALKKPIAT